MHPETPEEGTLLAEFFSNFSSENLARMMARLQQAADEEGLPFRDRLRTFNSRLAQELGKWAEGSNKGEAFHQAVFEAYFAKGINIAIVHELVDIAVSVGLPREESEAVLVKRTFKAEVDEDWMLSQKKGITAVPTFVVNTNRLIGAHPYETLENFLEANGVKKRTRL